MSINNMNRHFFKTFRFENAIIAKPEISMKDRQGTPVLYKYKNIFNFSFVEEAAWNEFL